MFDTVSRRWALKESDDRPLARDDARIFALHTMRITGSGLAQLTIMSWKQSWRSEKLTERRSKPLAEFCSPTACHYRSPKAEIKVAI
jgi:hypothetical protein